MQLLWIHTSRFCLAFLVFIGASYVAAQTAITTTQLPLDAPIVEEPLPTVVSTQIRVLPASPATPSAASVLSPATVSSTDRTVTTILTTVVPSATNSTTISSSSTLNQVLFEVPAPTPEPPEYEKIGFMKSLQKQILDAPRAGRIVGIYIDIGKHFKQDDLLFEFDCSVLRTEIEGARLLHQGEKIKRRQTENAVAAGEMIEEELSLARLQVELALNKLNHLRKNVNSCYVKAPFAGIVQDLHVSLGANVKFLMPLADIIYDQAPHFVLEVPVAWLQWLEVGEAFSIEIDALGQHYPATVTSLANQVNPVSQTLTATAKVEDPDGNLRAGMEGRAVFKQAE